MHALLCGTSGVGKKDSSGTFLCSVPAPNSAVASSCLFFLSMGELAPSPTACRKYPNSRRVLFRNADVLTGGW